MSVVTLHINDELVSARSDQKLLEVIREQGIDIPTLCHLPGKPAQTSCMVCLVKLQGRPRLVPACATVCEEGMRIESETDEVRDARRTAVELLLGEHLGDCTAPCQGANPAGLNIPVMLRHVIAGNLPAAMGVVLESVALPAVLARIEAEPGEKACRRAKKDSAVAIRAIVQHIADTQKAQRGIAGKITGKRVAVVGAGSAGLMAAWTLRRIGHACDLFEAADTPGGKLRDVSPAVLGRGVLAADIQRILEIGVAIHCQSAVDAARLNDLRQQYDAVIVATGHGATTPPESPGLFTAGAITRGGLSATRAAAEGQSAAVKADQFLCGRTPVGSQRPFSTYMGKLLEGELELMLSGANPAERWAGEGDRRALTDPQAAAEAARCLHCDCRKADTCRLRTVSAKMDAAARRFPLSRRRFEQIGREGNVIYEPGKCIKCGLCVAITRDSGEDLGLTFVGRGFDVRVAVPFDKSLEEALQKVAQQCIDACPTGALAARNS